MRLALVPTFILMFCILLSGMALSVCAAPAGPRPAVIELFTSQGCSSCPPAEALLRDLAKRPDVLALAFHVDYWDNLGWPDRYSMKAATTRQNEYAAQMKLDSIYTPQMVIDGTIQLVGSDRAAVTRILSRQGPVAVPVHLEQQGNTLAAEIGAAPQNSGTNGNILLVAYQARAATSIRAGENAGRTIEQINIVRSIRQVGRWNGAVQSLKLSTADFPEGSSSVALLLQEPGPGAILGAASVALHE